MNSKTAKLLRKTASVLAFQRFKETQDLPDRDRIYQNLKAQWNGMSPRERGKSRAEMKRLVDLAFRKPSGAAEARDVDSGDSI